MKNVFKSGEYENKGRLPCKIISIKMRLISSKKDKAFQIYKNQIFELNDVNTSIGHKMNLVVKRKQNCWQDVSIGRVEYLRSVEIQNISPWLPTVLCQSSGYFPNIEM